MKRNIYIIMCLLLICLCGCSKNESNNNSNKTNNNNADTISISDLSGTWTDEASGSTLTLDGNGFYLQTGGSNIRVYYEDCKIENNILFLRSDYQSTSYEFTINSNNNIITLSNSEYTFISNTNTSEPAIIELKIGEKATTDVVEFKLTDYGYTEKLDASSMTPIESGSGIGAGGDLTYASVSYEVNNIGKSELSPTSDISFTIDYNNGYLFTMDDGHMAYIVDEPYVFFKYAGNGAGNGALLTVSPLSTKDYTNYIACSNKLSTDTSSPLCVIVTLPTSTGSQDFKYIIQ